MKRLILALLAIAIGFAVSSEDAVASRGAAISLYTVRDWNALAVAKCQSMFPSATSCLNTLVTQSNSGLSCQSPIVITTATTINGGCYQSTTPGTCAIQVNDHTDPILVENATIISPAGTSGICGQAVNVTITNNDAWETGGQSTAVIVNITCQTGVTCSVTGNRFSIQGLFFGGNGSGTIVDTEGNLFFNMETSGLGHAIQYGAGIFSGSIVSGNVIINQPNVSWMNDAINLSDSVCTSGSPCTVTQNVLLGLYGNPANTLNDSGCGIISDGSSSATGGTSTQYWNVTQNTLIAVTNCGIAFAGGHNNTTDGTNIIVASGITLGAPITYMNVGEYVSNFTGQSGAAFGNSQMNGDGVFLLKPSGLSSGTQPSNNSSFTQSACSTTCTITQLSTTYTIAEGIALEDYYIGLNFGRH